MIFGAKIHIHSLENKRSSLRSQQYCKMRLFTGFSNTVQMCNYSINTPLYPDTNEYPRSKIHSLQPSKMYIIYRMQYFRREKLKIEKYEFLARKFKLLNSRCLKITQKFSFYNTESEASCVYLLNQYI